MKCTNCGNEVEQTSRYCAVCGTPVLEDLEIDHEQIKDAFYQKQVKAASYYVQDEKRKIVRQRINVPANRRKITESKNGAKLQKGLAFLVLAAFLFALIATTAIGRQLVAEVGVNKDGSGMVAVNGVIYNNAGGINSDFEGEEINLYTDPGGKIGAFVLEDGDVFLIESNLRKKHITDGGDEIEMNYSGEYIYIATKRDSKYGEALLVYNVKSRKIINLKEDIGVDYMVASPDGKTVVYSTVGGIYMTGIGGVETKISESGYCALSVSNDRKVVFFTDYEKGLMCWKNGEIKQVCENDLTEAVINSDCTKILYTSCDDDKEFLNYYDSDSLEDKKKIVENCTGLNHKQNSVMTITRAANYLPESDTFEGVIVESLNELYWLDGNADAVRINEFSEYKFSCNEFKLFVFDGENILLTSYEAGECADKVVYTPEGYMVDFAVSDDYETLWIVYEDKIVMNRNGHDKTILTAETGEFDIDCMQKDPLTGDIYCITPKGKLYKFDEKKGAVHVTSLNEGDLFCGSPYELYGMTLPIIYSSDFTDYRCLVYGNIVDVE